MIHAKMGDQGEGISQVISGFQGYHEEQLQHHQQQQEFEQYCIKVTGGDQGFMLPAVSEAAAGSPHILPWSLPLMHDHPPYSSGFFASPSTVPPAPSFYGDIYSRRSSTSLQSAYHGGGAGAGAGAGGGLYVSSEDFLRDDGMAASFHAEFGSMTAQDVMDAKALAASKSHSEAERRRRERINSHLAKLRSLLPSTTKTDKASLLAEVIQHVKELKRQTSAITTEDYSLEADELTVDAEADIDQDGRFLVRASLCCEDRSDLMPDLIRALKSLRLRTIKSEITTVGGRVKNVLVVTGEDDQQQSIASIQDALKTVMERPVADDESATSNGGGTKRQRTNKMPVRLTS